MLYKGFIEVTLRLAAEGAEPYCLIEIVPMLVMKGGLSQPILHFNVIERIVKICATEQLDATGREQLQEQLSLALRKKMFQPSLIW